MLPNGKCDVSALNNIPMLTVLMIYAFGICIAIFNP